MINNISSGKNVYESLKLDLPTSPVQNGKTNAVTQLNPLPVLNQNYNSNAIFLQAGTANTSINFADSKVSSVAGSQSTSKGRTAQQIISSLAPLKSNPAKFAAEVNKILKNSDERSTLIKSFGLDSAANKKNLGIAMFLEAGQGLSKAEMMPVGAVILNRALANNLALAASGKTPKFNISDIVREKSQFAIKNSYNSALNGGRKDAVEYGNSQVVQNMVTDLCKGQVGSKAEAKTAFFFQRATLRNQSFRAGDHSFSPTPSSTAYVNGNYLVGAGNSGYRVK